MSLVVCALIVQALIPRYLTALGLDDVRTPLVLLRLLNILISPLVYGVYGLGISGVSTPPNSMREQLLQLRCHHRRLILVL